MANKNQKFMGFFVKSFLRRKYILTYPMQLGMLGRTSVISPGRRRKRKNISFLAFVAKFAGYSILSVFSLTVVISFFLELISYISCFHAWLSLAVFRMIFRRSNFFYVNFIHLYLYSTNYLMRILRVLVCL